MMVCLDTSFIVDLLRGNKEARALLVQVRSQPDTPTIAAPTVMELMSSAKRDLGGAEQVRVDEFLAGIEVLSLDAASARLAGEVEAKLILAGETVPAVDVMIGAIARHHNEALITRNTKHFNRVPGLEVLGY